jgi:hypothetical protein
MARFEDYLRRARVCFVVFGAVERQRVVDRLVEANKLIWAKGFATRLVGYLAPPVKRGADAAFANLAVVDASRGFDGAAVDRVLEGLAP